MRRSVMFLLLLFAIVATMTQAATAQGEQFIGEIKFVGFNFAPAGWALCDGSLLRIANNTALFSLLGTTYGGDGVTTFALPDLRGRLPVGVGQGAGLTNRDLGQTGGAEQVTLTAEQMPAHSHSLNASSAVANSTSPGGNLLAETKNPGKETYSTAGASATLNPAAIGSAGSGQPHENMPPFLTLNCIIALTGIFPARY